MVCLAENILGTTTSFMLSGSFISPFHLSWIAKLRREMLALADSLKHYLRKMATSCTADFTLK